MPPFHGSKRGRGDLPGEEEGEGQARPADKEKPPVGGLVCYLRRMIALTALISGTPIKAIDTEG
jgi:hypothetical protein